MGICGFGGITPISSKSGRPGEGFGTIPWIFLPTWPRIPFAFDDLKSVASAGSACSAAGPASFGFTTLTSRSTSLASFSSAALAARRAFSASAALAARRAFSATAALAASLAFSASAALAASRALSSCEDLAASRAFSSRAIFTPESLTFLALGATTPLSGTVSSLRCDTAKPGISPLNSPGISPLKRSPTLERADRVFGSAFFGLADLFCESIGSTETDVTSFGNESAFATGPTACATGSTGCETGFSACASLTVETGC